MQGARIPVAAVGRPGAGPRLVQQWLEDGAARVAVPVRGDGGERQVPELPGGVDGGRTVALAGPDPDVEADAGTGEGGPQCLSGRHVGGAVRGEQGQRRDGPAGGVAQRLPATGRVAESRRTREGIRVGVAGHRLLQQPGGGSGELGAAERRREAHPVNAVGQRPADRQLTQRGRGGPVESDGKRQGDPDPVDHETGVIRPGELHGPTVGDLPIERHVRVAALQLLLHGLRTQAVEDRYMVGQGAADPVRGCAPGWAARQPVPLAGSDREPVRPGRHQVVQVLRRVRRVGQGLQRHRGGRR